MILLPVPFLYKVTFLFKSFYALIVNEFISAATSPGGGVGSDFGLNIKKYATTPTAANPPTIKKVLSFAILNLLSCFRFFPCLSQCSLNFRLSHPCGRHHRLSPNRREDYSSDAKSYPNHPPVSRYHK